MTSLAEAETARASAMEPPATRSAGWWVVAGQELRDIWFSARGPSIIIAYSLLLSLLTYLAASNEELNIIDQRDTVNLVTQIAMALAVVVGLLFSADSISGERERETLESLLLTPVPRRQIALGKFLAAVSVWPVMLAVAIPYIWALRAGTELFADALLAAAFVGTLLVLAFASLGLLVSIFSTSNRLSLAVTFFIFVVLLAPTQLPLSGWFGDLIKQVNPMTAGSTFLQRVIVREVAWGDELHLLIAPLVAAVVLTTVAFIAAGRLRLHGGLGK
jgi:ABC-2 type transport system permease protein